MNIETNLKYSSEIITRYVNKYSNFRICSELNLRKMKPFIHVSDTCDFIKNDINTCLEDNDYALAYNRCILLVKLLEDLAIKLDYSFNVESARFSEFESRKLDDLICIDVRQVGIRYFKATDNKKYMQEMELLLGNVIRSHSRKCRYAILMLKLESLNDIKDVFKFILGVTKDCKSYVSLSSYKFNTVYLRDIITELNDITSEIKDSCKTGNIAEHITTLTKSDMGYIGAGDTVIFAKTASELFEGMRKDLLNNLGYLSLE